MYRLEARSALKSSLGGGFWSWYFAYCTNGKEHKVQKALQVSTREGPEKKEEKEYMEPFPPLPPPPAPLPGKAIIALFSLQITVALWWQRRIKWLYQN